jgi:nucleotide-binding universal stress UspA family protein
MTAFKIEKILIPIDFSETAFIAIEHAAFIAQTFKAELVLLHVVERHWEQFNIIQPELVVPNPSEITQVIEKKLEQVASDIFAKYGVKSTAITSDGSIFSEIVAVADEHNVDLVIMGTHGTKGFVQFFIGSNTYKVVTQSNCPVLSVQKHAEKVSYKNIVLPIDDSMHSRQKVNHAISIAKAFDSTIHIIGLHESGGDKKFELKLEQIEEYIQKSGGKFTRKIFKDTNQARVSHEYAKAINADLIIIMTDQDENITGRLLGTYAQQIVNHSEIPVLSIRPQLGIIEYPSLIGGYHGA